MFVLCAAAMWLIELAAPGLDFMFGGQRALALGLAGAAAVVATISIVGFFRAGTTVDPTAPEKARALVVDGLYRYSRNPMYLALLVGLNAWGLWIGNPIAFVGPVFFAWIITQYQIRPEEAALREKFGEDYEDYCRRVRRWV